MPDYSHFSDFGLSAETLAALELKGFTEPTPIQQLTIPPLLENRSDVIAQAQTGTGKTAAYGIPVIEILRRDAQHIKSPRALVLAPTRELAMQIEAELHSLCGPRALRTAVFCGGCSMEVQFARLKMGLDIAIGTPGRLLDLLRRGALDLSAVCFAVLDEADEMLDMGFIGDIEAILEKTPSEKRTLMFSATIPEEIRGIAERFMRDPLYVSTRTDHTPVESIRQIACEVRREEKNAALERILAASDDPYAMVFCRTRMDVDEVTEAFQKMGYPVEALHGELTQGQRTRIINRFKARQFPVLIATDVAARGLDINDLTLVVNYSLPQNAEIYIHRIGRTGRAGKEGTAVTLTTPGERRRFEMIRQETGGVMHLEPLPGPDAVVAMKKKNFLRELRRTEESGVSRECRDFALELLREAADPVETLSGILQMHFHDDLSEAKYPPAGKAERRKLARKRMRLRLSPAGEKEGLTPSRLMKMLAEKAHIWRSKIGRITIGDHFSIVELPGETALMVLDAFRDSEIRAEALSVPEEPEGRRECGAKRRFCKK